MTEVLSSRKLHKVPAFKGKDVTGQELSNAVSCPALQALKKSPKETSPPHRNNLPARRRQGVLLYHLHGILRHNRGVWGASECCKTAWEVVARLGPTAVGCLAAPSPLP